MAANNVDVLLGDDYETILNIIEADMLDNDEEFNAEMEESIRNIPSSQENRIIRVFFVIKFVFQRGA